MIKLTSDQKNSKKWEKVTKQRNPWDQILSLSQVHEIIYRHDNVAEKIKSETGLTGDQNSCWKVQIEVQWRNKACDYECLFIQRNSKRSDPSEFEKISMWVQRL